MFLTSNNPNKAKITASDCGEYFFDKINTSYAVHIPYSLLNEYTEWFLFNWINSDLFIPHIGNIKDNESEILIHILPNPDANITKWEIKLLWYILRLMFFIKTDNHFEVIYNFNKRKIKGLSLMFLTISLGDNLGRRLFSNYSPLSNDFFITVPENHRNLIESLRKNKRNLYSVHRYFSVNLNINQLKFYLYWYYKKLNLFEEKLFIYTKEGNLKEVVVTEEADKSNMSIVPLEIGFVPKREFRTEEQIFTLKSLKDEK
jgi:hypothetical protein